MAPPAKASPPTEANQIALKNWLLSIMAFRPETAGKPWTFYEEIDKYLGPWGIGGYPIAYGKPYCVLFSSDRRLDADLAGRAWIRRTLLLLQEALKDYILDRFRRGTLGSITAAELTDAAFDSHPFAYTEAGLTMVVMLSPGLALHVAAIPRAEFNPFSDNFGATVQQVVMTASVVVPRGVAMLLASNAGPAHSNTWGRAMAMDRARVTNQMNLGVALYEAKRAVAAGRCDNVALMDRMATVVSTLELPDSSLATLARSLLTQLASRRQYVRLRYQAEIQGDPGLLKVFRAFDPKGL